MEQLIGSIFVGFLCLSWLCYFMYAGAIIAPNMRDYTSDARLLKDYKTKKWCLIIEHVHLLYQFHHYYMVYSLEYYNKIRNWYKLLLDL